MSRLRVGYVLKRFPRASETFIAQEILELEARGVEVEVFALRPNDAAAPHAWLRRVQAPRHQCSGVPLSEAWKWLHARAADESERPAVEWVLERAFRHPSRRGRHRLCEAVGLAQAAADRGLDHLHAHFANEPAFVALLAHRLLGVPFSFTAHAKDVYAKGPSGFLWRRLAEEASFVVTVCEANRLHLERLLGPGRGGKVRRLYNGVDLEAVAPASAGAAEGSRSERLDVLCVARLVEKKGLDVLLRGLALLARRGRPLRCAVVGEGPERQTLERLRTALGLESIVELPGTLAHEKVVERMRRSAVFALPARVAENGDRDALPTVLLEAMACGLPCVSTPVTGIPEIVEHLETGLLVPAGNPWALAEALDELFRRPDLGVRLGTAGRRRAERLFDRRRNVAILHAWFGEAAGGRGAGTRVESALAGASVAGPRVAGSVTRPGDPAVRALRTGVAGAASASGAGAPQGVGLRWLAASDPHRGGRRS